ncbi:alpha/beta hydrolase [Dactylosporangium sp. NPDC048998]|uniref:alpha/beta hydrolase n=1 Tax=Dactylosporangium sp. NPDC048998 TaxID=3363976 RepID=UPI003720F300
MNWLNRRTICAVAVVAVLLALVLGTGAGLFDGVPLLNPAAAGAIELLALAALVGSWARRDQRWLSRTLPLLWGSALVLTVAAVVTLRVTGTIRDRYPPIFAAWFALAVAAIAGVPFALSRPGLVRRIAAVSAVPLTLAGGLLVLDQVYAVWPNVGDLLGHTRALGGGALDRALRAPPPAVREQGLLGVYDMPATISHFQHRPGYVYLPPAYFTADRPNLPVIVVLAGVPGWTSQWPQAGKAVTTAAGYAADHHGVAPVLVFVDQNGGTYRDTECVDGPLGNAETFLTVDIPAFVTATLHIPHHATTWAVVGFSEGGTCAADLVLRHPGIFRHLVDLGGESRPTLHGPRSTLLTLFDGSAAAERAHDPVYLLATRRYDQVSAWFAAGADDPRGIVAAHQLAQAAAAAGATSHEFTGDGGHNWQFAGTAFAQVLPQLAQDLGIH